MSAPALTTPRADRPLTAPPRGYRTRSAAARSAPAALPDGWCAAPALSDAGWCLTWQWETPFGPPVTALELARLRAGTTTPQGQVKRTRQPWEPSPDALAAARAATTRQRAALLAARSAAALRAIAATPGLDSAVLLQVTDCPRSYRALLMAGMWDAGLLRAERLAGRSGGLFCFLTDKGRAHLAETAE